MLRGGIMHFFDNDELYKLMFEKNLDAIMLMSPDGVIYKTNPSACEMFQTTEGDLCKIGINGIADTGDHRLHQFLRRLETEGRARSELNMVKRNGIKFPAELTACIFKDKQGKPVTVTTIRDITELKKALENLWGLQRETEYHASYDYLTGIYNRRAFIEKLMQEMNRSQRDRMPMSLILLDVDKFKQINDTKGHLAGDTVLKKVAQSLSENLRSYDILGRYGGDEFILCLPNTAGSESRLIAERLRNAVEQTKIIYDKERINVTASLGVVTHYHTAPETLEDLISKVDGNLYEAKRCNNGVHVEPRAI
jgi:diguanylate cyclase (GGDEF)-like protein/PAS domain S-box-containing protein